MRFPLTFVRFIRWNHKDVSSTIPLNWLVCQLLSLAEGLRHIIMASHTEGPTKAIFYALGANDGVALAKFAAAAFTGSGAMLAEAIHSLADCTNQVFLLSGLKESRKPTNDTHPMA